MERSTHVEGTRNKSVLFSVHLDLGVVCHRSIICFNLTHILVLSLLICKMCVTVIRTRQDTGLSIWQLFSSSLLNARHILDTSRFCKDAVQSAF